MSRFDVEEFGFCAGDFDQLVVNAKKYTKEQTVEIFNRDYEYTRLKARLEDVGSGYVRYFVRPSQDMCRDTMDGVYGFVDGPGKGSFPVWILTLADLEPSSDAK